MTPRTRLAHVAGKSYSYRPRTCTVHGRARRCGRQRFLSVHHR